MYLNKRLPGLSKLSYCDRLISLYLETLERQCLVHDLAFCYKMLYKLCDVSLPAAFCVETTDFTKKYFFTLKSDIIQFCIIEQHDCD